MKLYTLIGVLLFTNYIYAQMPTGKSTNILQSSIKPYNGIVSEGNAWNVSLITAMDKGHGVPNSLEHIAQKQKSALGLQVNTRPISKITRGNPPLMGTNFVANKLETVTPTDNSVAVSNAGIVVSVDNATLEYYQEDGTPLAQVITWNDFLNNDTSLVLGKYDPRVMYDNVHDRFITVILHGPLSKLRNKIIVAFSKTNNPLQGWNIYTLPGNPYSDTSFADYPSVGFTNNELFINVNLFKTIPPYNYNQSLIYQISLSNGYGASPTLDYKIWGDSITTPTGLPGFTIVPASNGLGKPMGPNMWFASTWPDGGDSNVYVYQITKELYDTSSQLLSYAIPIPVFNICADAKMPGVLPNTVDSISTGSSITQNAFYLDSTIHFTFDADIQNGYCGVNYGRINLRTNTAQVKQFGINNTWLTYPAVASFGSTDTSKEVVLAYVQADQNTLPQTAAVAVDKDMNFSAPIIVKTGDTTLDIIPGTERWGDYTGIHRRFKNNSNIPEVWMAGAYSATNARPNSYNTWVAQLLNSLYPLAVGNINVKENVTLYPNPSNNIFNIAYNNPQTQEVFIRLLDANGKIVLTIHNGLLPKGETKIQFNKGALNSGVYTLQIYTNKGVVNTKEIIVL